ncbi:MAG: hypothetical protein ACK6A8_15735, partial [Planctomycetota bacterium]
FFWVRFFWVRFFWVRFFWVRFSGSASLGPLLWGRSLLGPLVSAFRSFRSSGCGSALAAQTR